MFAGYVRPRVTWRDYRKPSPIVIHPMSLPKVINEGFGELGFISFILDLFKTSRAKKKAAEARREAARKAAIELAKIEAQVKAKEEYLKKRWETEVTSRAESERLEQVKIQYESSRPPVYTWEDISLMNATGNTLVQMSK